MKSGRVSPYFFNSSKFNTGPLIEQLGQYYASAIQQHAPDCSLVFGPAYKGIPLCVTVATALSKKLNRNIGYFFNRKEIKTHGDQGTLVGQLPQPVDITIMVDDVFTDGHTKIESVDLFGNSARLNFLVYWWLWTAWKAISTVRTQLLNLSSKQGFPSGQSSLSGRCAFI